MDLCEMLKLPPETDRNVVENQYYKVVESYRLVAQASENNATKELAEKRLEQLILAGKEYGFAENSDEVKEIEWQGDNLYKAKLAMVSDNLDALGRFVWTLGDSSEELYVKAIYELRRNNYSISGLNSAMKLLTEAMLKDPDNEYYSVLFNIIKKEVSDYNAAQQKKEEEKKRQEDRRRKAIEDEAKRKAIWDGIGTAFSIGLGLACLGCCIACCCECKNECC